MVQERDIECRKVQRSDSRDAVQDRRGKTSCHFEHSGQSNLYNYVQKHGERSMQVGQHVRTWRSRSRWSSSKIDKIDLRSESAHVSQNVTARQSGGSSSSSSAPADKKKKGKSESDSGTGDDEIVHFDWKFDMILHSRYRLLKLCGDGTFGRVVLAHDSSKTREVAIKIIRDVPRYLENAKIEANILMDIREADPEGKSGCAIMYDHFIHCSKFFCMVFEPLGTSLYDFLSANEYRGYWMQDIQAFGRQCMEALAFLHGRLHLTHTDLKPENVLLHSLLPARESSFPREAEWRRSNKPPSGFSMKPYMRPASNAIKIIDFGNATYHHEQHSSIINTRQYRGPEVLLSCGWNEFSDQWSIGCILMELYSGNQLFETHEEMEHLALMERIIGPLPTTLIFFAPRNAKDKWFVSGTSGFRLAWPENASSSSSLKHVSSQRPLHQQLPSIHTGLSDFCSDLLVLDPSARKSADEMLRHPFLSRANSYDD